MCGEPSSATRTLSISADALDDAHAFVARNERRRGLHRPVPVRRVDVGVAEARGLDLDQYLAGSRLRDRPILDDQSLLERFTTAAFMTTSPRVISDHHLRLPAIEPTPAKDLPARGRSDRQSRIARCRRSERATFLPSSPPRGWGGAR